MAGVGKRGVNPPEVSFTRLTSNLFLGICSTEKKAKLKINLHQSSQRKAIRVSGSSNYNSNYSYCYYL